MKKKFLYALILSFSAFIFIIFFKGLDKINIYVPKDVSNKKFINFVSKDLISEEEIVFQDLLVEKKFTVLNIWSSWCIPCRSEHKFLIQLSNNQRLNLIGLNYKDDNSNAIKFLAEYGNPFSNIFLDLDGIISIELGAFGVPETYIINNNKKIVIKKYIGPLDKKKFNEISKIVN
tara:strand:- start:97 stop:621 length:525 start_codon:yes stop_codon:yes gene_type:complete